MQRLARKTMISTNGMFALLFNNFERFQALKRVMN